MLDLSHINIWHRGDFKQVEETFNSLLSKSKGIHLSHNDGRNDSHDLIPNGIWFEKLIDRWATTKLVTYESLPHICGMYERLDKKNRKLFALKILPVKTDF